MIRRRPLLGLLSTAALAPVSWQLWAAPAAARDSRLIVVFLRGGYDALSALVPNRLTDYYEARPHIAVPAPEAGNPNAALALDADWALHPALAPTLMPLWRAQQVAFVPFAGTGFVSRSHFEAQDWMEFGQPAGGRPDTGSGFLNRLLTTLDGRRDGIAFTEALPPSLRGGVPVANVPVRQAPGRALDTSYAQLAQALYAGHPLAPLLREGLGLRREVAMQMQAEPSLQAEMLAASRGAPPAGSFALEAWRIGRLLREHPRYGVGFIEVGGWDTHVGQGMAGNGLASAFQRLGEGLATLAQTLGPEWQRTVVVVMSEFGRTFRENGSRGTDHGHGSTMWVLGGDIRGGRIAGEQTALGLGHLHQDRDLPVLNEYRAVIGGLLADRFGLRAAQVARVFPGVDVRPGVALA